MCILACSFFVVVSSALLYIATVCLILPCWKKVSGGPELGGSLSQLVGVLVGAGWLGLFYGYWSFSKASKILLGAMIDSSFKWLLMENSL